MEQLDTTASQAVDENRAGPYRCVHATPMAQDIYRTIGFVDRSPVTLLLDMPTR